MRLSLLLVDLLKIKHWSFNDSLLGDCRPLLPLFYVIKALLFADFGILSEVTQMVSNLEIEVFKELYLLKFKLILMINKLAEL